MDGGQFRFASVASFQRGFQFVAGESEFQIVVVTANCVELRVTTHSILRQSIAMEDRAIYPKSYRPSEKFI